MNSARTFNHTARYLTPGVYFLPDSAAGLLCRSLGEVLPPVNHWQAVTLSRVRQPLTARLLRVYARFGFRKGIKTCRGWVWAVTDIRADGLPVELGRSFKFRVTSNSAKGETSYPIASDHRYAIAAENYGAGRVSYALRFDGEFLMSSPFYESAANAATKHAGQS